MYNVIAIVMNIIIPDTLNPTAWNWKAKAGFFYASLCLPHLIWTFFRLPEPKGRAYAELDVLFEDHVPARIFKTTPVGIFNAEIDVSRRASEVVVDRDERTEKTKGGVDYFE